MSLILGIDPGAHGAITFLNTAFWTANVVDIPNFEVQLTTKNKPRKDKKTGEELPATFKMRTEIDLDKLAGMFMPELIEPEDEVLKAFIEQVSSRPKDGAVQAFSFGANFGAIQMACAAARWPRQKVPPQTWKKSYGLLKKEKSESRRVASEHAPACSHYWARAKDDGRAESFLIALWGANSLGFKPTRAIQPANRVIAGSSAIAA